MRALYAGAENRRKTQGIRPQPIVAKAAAPSTLAGTTLCYIISLAMNPIRYRPITRLLSNLDLLTIGALERVALAACLLAILWLGAAWALA